VLSKIGTDRPFRPADLYCLLDVTHTYGFLCNPKAKYQMGSGIVNLGAK